MSGGDPDAAATWTIRPGSDRSVEASELVRPIRVGGPAGYLDPIAVEPGSVVKVHLSAPSAHRIGVHRPGRTALLDPMATDGDDWAESELLALLNRPLAAAHPVRPGSYAVVAPGSLNEPSSSICVWLRVWRLPSVDEVWNWAGVLTDFDFPQHCGLALAIDSMGRPAVYAGGGGSHRQGAWEFAETRVDDRLGEWLHLASVIGESATEIYLDGVCVHEGAAAEAAAGPPRSLRIAAAAEQGVVDHLLDADLSCLALASAPLGPDDVGRLADDRGVRGLERELPGLQAFWPMCETAGDRLGDSSGNRRDAQLVNGATRGIPGPSAGPGAGRPGYEPSHDPLRGGAVRFSSDDLLDAGWPVAAEVEVPADADSGVYSVGLTMAGERDDESVELPFVVVRTRPRRPGSLAVLAPTFTWAAYGRRPMNDVVVPGLGSSFYSRHVSGRLFFEVGLRLPMPRLSPFIPRSHRLAETLHRHLVRPERFAEAWLEREGYAFEFITDAELDSEPELLGRYAALMIVGHSEYWTEPMRAGVEAYLDDGGDVLCLSGNTLYWRVSFDPETAVLEARKTSETGEQDPWLGPTEWGERWHSDGAPGGSWSLLGRPGNQLLGLETLGWIDSGDASSFAPYRVEAPDHPLFHEPEAVPLDANGAIGSECLNGPAVSGYEMDGLPEALGLQPATSEGRVLLAHAAGQHYVERFTTDPGHGADVIWWERPDAGRVFNAGSIGYTGALAVDPGIQALTRNVLARFGVGRR